MTSLRMSEWEAMSIITFFIFIRSLSIKSARISSSMFPSAPSDVPSQLAPCLSSFVSIADDVAGFSIVHSGRGIVQVMAPHEVETIEHHL